MATWASIVGGVVHELTTTDPTDRYHADVVWVPCAGGVAQGDLYDGTTFSKPPLAPAPVPQRVAMVQAQLALQATPSATNGNKTMLDDVNAFVAASANPRIKIAWEKGTVVERDGLFVVAIAAMIPGLDTVAARDALFIAAAAINT